MTTASQLHTGQTTLIVDYDFAASGHRIGVSTAGDSPLYTTPSDNGQIDAFGRIRISDPTNLFDSSQIMDDSPLAWYEKITDTSGSAASTWLPNEAAKQLTVGTDDTIIRQSREYFRYRPGKSQLILTTFVLAAPATGLTQRVGYFDAENGIFLETTGTTTNVVRRTFVSGAAVNNKVAQADWNLDPLDGTGPSGRTLDLTKAQILIIDLEWLGVGRARIGFVIDGKIYYVHQFLNTNTTLTSVYMTTASLPVRYEISYTGAGTKSMKAICTSVSSEGGEENPYGVNNSATTGATMKTVSTAYLPIISIRPRATFNGKTNRGKAFFEQFDIFSEDSPAAFQIVYGASLDGASWLNVNQDYSFMQYDVSATGTSGGLIIDTGYVGGGRNSGGIVLGEVLGKLPLSLDIDGNHPASPLSDVVTLKAVRVGTTNTDVAGAFNWKELA